MRVPELLFKYLVWILLAQGTTTAVAQEVPSVEQKAAAYIPSYATLVRIRPWSPGPGAGNIGVAAIGPLVHAGEQDLAFVFQHSGGLILRMVEAPGRSSAPIDAPLPGNYVVGVRAIPDGMLLKSLVGAGTDEVMVVTSEGASVGLYLNVFSAHDGRLVSLTTAKTIGGHDFDIDCAARHVCRIIAYDKWVDLDSARLWIFEWLGGSFVETDTDAETYYLKKLEEIGTAASADVPMQPLARSSAAGLAVQLYLRLNDVEAAVKLCQAVLSRLDNPKLDEEPSRSVIIKNRTAELQLRLRNSKAITHELLAKALMAAGRVAEARREYQLSSALRSGREAR